MGYKNIIWFSMLQKLPVNNFEWIKDTSQFNEGLIKNGNKESNEKKVRKFIIFTKNNENWKRLKACI